MGKSVEERQMRNWFALYLPVIDVSEPRAKEIVEVALKALGLPEKDFEAFHEGRYGLPFDREVYTPPPSMQFKGLKIKLNVRTHNE